MTALTLQGVLIPLGTALIMAIGQYSAKMKKDEVIDLGKLGRTMAAGLGAGLIAWITGNQPDLANPATVGATGFLTGIIDVVTKLGWRVFSRKG